ncbi:MAG: GNAT family N-acetyltransferase [Proteobacteria bacterium]|nr:GNAT family N-acetyltransferase [Pseudomonadota bacterium]
MPPKTLRCSFERSRFKLICASGHPDFQGQGQGRGAGSALMSTLVAEARRIGLAELWAEVSVTAELFFSKSGFRIVEERNPFIIDAPAKQRIMRREISTSA